MQEVLREAYMRQRVLNGLSLRDMGNALDIHFTTLHRFENGNDIDFVSFCKLLAFFKIEATMIKTIEGCLKSPLIPLR